jgi:hypothetical protein
MRSAATTQVVATSGSSTTIHPATPAAARAIMVASPALRPPSPRRIASRNTNAVRTAWAPTMIRLHEAPSARCEA